MNLDSYDLMLETAIEAACRSGKEIENYKDVLSKLDVQSKNKNDFVSEVDIISEEIIIDVLHSKYPTHSLVSEESGGYANSKSDYQWIIDPLDGTTNYIFGIPHYAVSIALKYKGVLEHAVVYDPSKKELFTASRGKGFMLNGLRHRSPLFSPSKKGIAVTGISRSSAPNIESYLKSINAVLNTSSIVDIRQAGSASLDLAYIACGRFSIFWQLNLKLWDIAAGVLLVEEAGGEVCDINGGYTHLETGNILAADSTVKKEILSKLRAI